jgi:GNAT superfamily N-acetyltransferase
MTNQQDLGADMGLAVRRIETLTEQDIAGLGALLADCVEGGASVSFMLPFSRAQARDYWRGLADDVAQGRRALLVAEAGGQVVGTVHLVLAQPDNQPHRADLCKMLVLRSARKQGIGAALMDAAERAAHSAGKSLLVLDTASPEAERLYLRMGWTPVGVIPGYALLPDGAPCDTRYFYRELR